MAKKSFYDEKEVHQFQEDVCKITCIMKGKCIEEGKDAHYFLMCPHYHSWKLGYGSFVWKNIKWEKEHPEKAKQRYLELVASAKAWAAEKRRLKKEQKAKENT